MVLISVGVIAWVLWDHFTPVPYNDLLHPYLLDKKTGHRRKPTELLDVAKIIKPTDDYINKTNSVDRLYDVIYQFKLENPFPYDHIYTHKRDLEVSGWPHSNLTKCGQDLRWILSKLDKFKSEMDLIKGKEALELMRLIDSNGKPSSSLYQGVLNWEGSYSHCKRVELRKDIDQHNDQAPEIIKMNYCWSKIKPVWWPQSDSMTLLDAVIRVGTCLPESCDTRSYDHFRDEISELVMFDWSVQYKEKFRLSSMFCLPDEQSPLRQIPTPGRVFLYVLEAWVLVIVLATILAELNRNRLRKKRRRISFYDHQDLKTVEEGLTLGNRQGKSESRETSAMNDSQELESEESLLQDILDALSLKKGLKSFLHVEYHMDYKHSPERPRLDTNWLNFLKVFMCACVVGGHSLLLLSLHMPSPKDRMVLASYDKARYFLAFGRFVDTFFVIFGLFGSFFLSKLNNLSTPLMWIYYNIGKFLRVGPVMIVVYIFSRYVAPYIGEGPWWDYGVNQYSLRGSCVNEEWWKVIPYLGTFGKFPASLCVPPAWFLTAYLQLGLIMPAFVYIIYHLPNHLQRCLFVIFLSLSSNLVFLSRLMRQESLPEEAFSTYGGLIATLIDKFQYVGTLSTFRHLGMIAASCYLGCLLRMYKEGSIRKWPRWISSRLSLYTVLSMSLIILIAPILGSALAGYLQVTPKLAQVAVANYILSVVWPILNCILIIQTTTVYNHSALLRFFSHPAWTILNKLGLCIYMIHWQVILYNISGNEFGASHRLELNFFRNSVHNYATTFSIALPAYFLIESPLSRLFSVLSIRLSRRPNWRREEGKQEKPPRSVDIN